MAEIRISQGSVQALVRDTTPEIQITQGSSQALVRDTTPEIQITQGSVQVLLKYYHNMGFDNDDSTNLYSDEGAVTESNLLYCIINEDDDISAATAIIGQDNNGALVDGEGVFEFTSEATAGTYVVVIQGTDNKIGAFITYIG